jgi:hypothetical protein
MVDKIGRVRSTHAEKRDAYRIQARKPEDKRQIERV